MKKLFILTLLSLGLFLAPKAVHAATITVNDTGDTAANDGTCNLREAIDAANNDTASGAAAGECAAGSGTDTINFSISGATPHTFTPASAYSVITTNLTIDGCSEPDAVANTAVAPNPFNGTLVVEIDGTSAGANVNGLNISDGTVAIRCLVINRFDGDAINISGGSNHIIAGNYLGTSTSGATDLGNGIFGVSANAPGIRVGGTDAADRNIISGNEDDGVCVCAESADNVTVLGNYIGVNAAGTGALGNSGDGVLYQGGADNGIVGGAAVGSKNIISANAAIGIRITSFGGTPVTNVDVFGNYIGTDYTGNVDLGNGNDGVYVSEPGTADIDIGGSASGEGNLISGNTQRAIAMDFVTNSTIRGNIMGLNINGTASIPNGSLTQFAAIQITGSTNITIGGTDSGARNVISGNNGHGILYIGGSPFGGSASTGMVVQGNYIGTNLNGEVHSGLGNPGAAIFMGADVQGALIGGISAGSGNVIAGNGGGVFVMTVASFQAINNSILGNSIYSNSGAPLSSLGIDLGTDNTADFAPDVDVGVTSNDTGDPDSGPNNYLNFPVISSVTSTNGTATITYSLDINDSETGATGYRVEFFANDTADPSGNGQGQTYIGADTVSGDVSGRQTTITLPAGVSGPKAITAVTTMTDASTDGFGHSSEFSAALTATLVAATSTSSSSGASTTSGDGLADTGESAKLIVFIAAMLLASGTWNISRILRQRLAQ